ncbi:MAG TPA: mechanosensitive ion channel [Leeuwenhoekiella sp.]|nr:mechanosensitive ion channel [Leeuwenhoekiella sp.]
MSTQKGFDTGGALQILTEKLHHWWDAIILRLPNMLIAILILVIFFFLAKILSSLLRKILRKHLKNQSVRRIITKLVYGTLLIAGFFIALDVLDLDKALTSLLAGAGVAALAIGLALQGTLSNTFSGIMLSFLPRIRIGDYIETESHAGFVHEISLRNLVLRRPDNHFVIMPNSKFIEEPFINFSLVTRARITVKCRVGYESNLRNVEALIKKAIAEKFEQQEGERIKFYFTEFGDSAIYFMTRFWIDYVRKSQMYAAQHEALILVMETLQHNRISIPYPISNVHLSKMDEDATDNSPDYK